MKPVEITLSGVEIDYDLARELARSVAEQNNPDAFLVSWSDKSRGLHSPKCLQCEIKDKPGWEVYGANHGGQLRISVNHDQYVFIYG